MQVCYSSKGLLDLSRLEKSINNMVNAGFGEMMLDLSIFYAKGHLETHGENGSSLDIKEMRGRYEKLMHYCSKGTIQIEIMRAPHLKWDTKRSDLNALMLQIGQECIMNCGNSGRRNIIIQPLFAGVSKVDEWKENHRYYYELGRIAAEKNVCILIENQCNNINGHLVRGVCADAVTASEWIDELNNELGKEIFGYCLDTAVCNLCGQNMGEMAATLGHRLKAVLIRECDGIHEASRLPFTGRNEGGMSTDWPSLIRGLRRIAFDGMLIIAAGDTLGGFSHLLRQQMYPVIKSTAEYFRWQIEMEKNIKGYPVRVLFGAGNMCRNYMKFYGKEYPPLFVCDNDSKLWGREICGLEIKAPEVLKELPPECAVIICNTFYSEIAGQLKSMGIENIETYSDEYLPECSVCK
ncbi:MAG: sugar phosphate isomerase/epimerase [Lachnospiraceae bacterium]|nr:sugar phosphate isomerase/epimerase [Lachnospiraceae bacterium]